METHRLILEGGSRDAEWLLEWDEATLVLKAPDGQPVVEAEATAAHRILNLHELFEEGKISLATSRGSLTFKKQRAALAAMRDLVESGLASDADFRAELRRESLRAIPRGLVMFIVGGGLFGLYCWYASWAPDPPRGHWIRWFGWLIHSILGLLMVMGVVGLLGCCLGVRQWLRLRRIERRANAVQGRA